MGIELAGNLSDLEFGQLLTVLAAMEHEGVLELWNLPRGKSVELHLKDGLLHCARTNGRPVKAMHVKPLLQELFHAERGAFKFHARRLQHGCSQPLSWPVERMLLSAHAEHDEQLHHQDDLPDPNQPYRLVQGVQLPSHPFLNGARPLFERAGGAGAKEVARRLDLPTDRVRYLMLKMIRKGWLEPSNDDPDTNWEAYRPPLM